MALCCIGGVCVPYSAVLPLLVLGLQWLIKKLYQAGLLPSSWTRFLHQYLENTTTTCTSRSNTSPKDACCDTTTTTTTATSENQHFRRGKQSKVTNINSSIAARTTITSCCTTTTTGTIVHISTEEEWESLIQSTTTASSVIAIKFTAPWCKPCQKIQPIFAGLGSTTNSSDAAVVQLVTVDVDELDRLAAKYNVLTLPTFIVLDRRTQTPIGVSYSGSDETKLRNWWNSILADELIKKTS